MMEVLRWNEMEDWDENRTPRESDDKSVDLTSNDDEKSSSYRSGSIVSSRGTKNSHQRSRTNLSVSTSSTDYSRFSQTEKVPCAESESRILSLLAGTGYTMTQVNGQRKLGPPPGWTKPAPDPSCEVFVGKLPRDVYEYAIYPIFQQVGEIYEIRLMMHFSGTNRGYCFVMFTKTEYAQRAIKELNNMEIRKGRRIGVVASTNNCRLCIGQLPREIDSRIVIKKFYEITDEVTKVSVYKYLNGHVRYALVWYQTHRGAAMARRRLLPERGTLFPHGEVSIDWAHPDMAPKNVVEESGVRDEKGVYQFTRTVIENYLKRTGLQKRGRDDFLEKSIKNYLEDNQRNKSLETSGCMERPRTRGGSFSARRIQKLRSNQQKSSVDTHRRSDNENCFSNSEIPAISRSQSRKEISDEENVFESPEDRAIDGNIETAKVARAIKAKNSKSDDTVFDPSEEFSEIAEKFVPEGSFSFNLFEHYTISSESPPDDHISVNYEQSSSETSRDRGDSQHRMKPAGFLHGNSTRSGARKREVKDSNFPDSISRKQQAIGKENLDPEINVSARKNRNRTHFKQSNFENPTVGQRSKNSPRALNQIGKYNGNSSLNQAIEFHLSTRNRADMMVERDNNYRFTRENLYSRDRNCSREFYDQPHVPDERNHCQRSIGLDHHGSHVFDNYFQGCNGHANNYFPNGTLQGLEILFPLGRFVPQSFYGTSSFADYRASQIQSDNNQPRPRPILSRMSAKNIENV